MATVRPKGLAAAFTLVLAGACLAGCQAPVTTTVEEAVAMRSAQAQAQVSVEAPVIAQDGVLRVAVLTSSGTPHVMEAPDGTLRGIDVDVAAALAQQMGLTLDLVPAASAAEAAQQGVDVVLGVGPQNDVGLSVVSSYMEEAVGVFVRDGEDLSDLAGIAGRGVAVVQGSDAQRAVTAVPGLAAAQRPYDDVDAAFDALDAGEVACVACSAYEGAYIALEHPSVDLVGTVDVPRSVGAGVDRSNTALVAAVQESLDAVGSNGVLSLIRSRWVGDLPALGADSLIESMASADAADPQGAADYGDDAPLAEDASAVPSMGAGDGSTAGSNAVTSIG